MAQQPYPGQQQQYYEPQQQYMAQNQNAPSSSVMYAASGTPVQVVNVNSNESRYEHYQSTSARILGILQISLGIIMVISQIVLTKFKFNGYQGMTGFYAPIFIISAGAFGILSASSKSRCSVVTTMVLSIISSILSTAAIGQGFSGVLVTFTCSWEGETKGCETGARLDTAVAFHAIMLIAGFMEFIVAICAAAYCCHGCCRHSRPQGAVLNRGPGGSVVTPGVQMTTVAYPQNGSYQPQGSYPQPSGAYPQYDGPTAPPGYQQII